MKKKSETKENSQIRQNNNSLALNKFKDLYSFSWALDNILSHIFWDILQIRKSQTGGSNQLHDDQTSGMPFPSPRDLPNPGIKPETLALQAGSLPSEPTGKFIIFILHNSKIGLKEMGTDQH